MTAEAVRCADASEARAEPLYGTASTVERWMLVEQPGSWGHDATTHSRLPEDVARELRRRVRDLGIRLVLIRRGPSFTGPGRQCYLVRSGAQEWELRNLVLDDAADLLDVDLRSFVTGRPVEGATLQQQPLFLVCTHGRHDACCSIRGNHVARVACATSGIDAWECSHIGGDRFAANVVCLPYGVYYGRVAAAEAAQLLRAYVSGRLSLDHYRGRCCYGFAMQAAEFFARRETGVIEVGEVVPTGDEQRSPGRLRATFGLPNGRYAEVAIEVTRSRQTYRLTCGATSATAIPRYELASCSVK